MKVKIRKGTTREKYQKCQNGGDFSENFGNGFPRKGHV